MARGASDVFEGFQAGHFKGSLAPREVCHLAFVPVNNDRAGHLSPERLRRPRP